jgi:hypothetical protein
MALVYDPGYMVSARAAETLLRQEADWRGNEQPERSPMMGFPQFRGPLTQAIPFELQDDATAPGSPVAYQAYRLQLPYAGSMSFQVTTGSTGADPSFRIHVLDMVGNLRAIGYDTIHGTTGSMNGARGWAVKSAPPVFGVNQDCWTIIAMQTQAQAIIVGTSGCVTGGGTFTAYGVLVMSAGPENQDPSIGGAQPVTIQNYSSAIGSTGGSTTGIVCLWNASITGYLVVDAPCPTTGCT